MGRRVLELGRLAGEPVEEVVLFDRGFGENAKGMGATLVEGDIGDEAQVRAVIGEGAVSVFHLASMVSGECEVGFDEAMRVNLDGGRHVLEACRGVVGEVRPRVVFASSLAAFGGPCLDRVSGDGSKRFPETTYGMTKVIGELMVNDYTRKGFIDGRAVRLPTIVVRPGKPNTAASSFASSLVRERLAGKVCVLPVAREQEHPVLGYRAAVECFVRVHDLDDVVLGADRTLTLPSVTVTVQEMVEAVETFAVERGIVPGLVVDEPDTVVRRIVGGWPTGTDGGRGMALGLLAAPGLGEIIRDYWEDFGNAGALKS